MGDFQLPWFTCVWWAFFVFAISLLFWHVVLIRVWPLSKTGWKKVDYWWVSLALLGVIGNVGAVRREVAENLSEVAKSRMNFAVRRVKQSIAFGHGPAVCRKFVRSEFSPPAAEFDRAQREYDEMCTWFTAAELKLPSTPFAQHKAITIDDLGTPIPTGADQWAIQNFRDFLNLYNSAVANVQATSHSARRSVVEDLLTVFGPSLLAIAIALRLAKVTGELRLG